MSDPPTRSAAPGGDPTADPKPATVTHDLHTATGPSGTATGITAPAALHGFELIEEVGAGGMGVVYRARETALDRDVAVKFLQDRFPAHSPAARRFLDEARITSQLQHPAIPPVHHVGTLPDGRPFLVMKLIKGSTLADLLVTEPADRGRFVAAFAQVCQAVAYAHARKVIHRDLKPSNVMVGAFREVQVMDWGLAKVLTGPPEAPESVAGGDGRTEIRTLRDADSATQARSVLGTPSFMSPEQAGGEIDRVDQRSDVFGLGAVLCAVLTGKPPYTAPDPDAVRLLAIRGQTADAFARLDACGADPELVTLCKRCLAADREVRPRDAGEVAEAVAAHLAAAEERARHAELDRVRAEGERTAAELKAAEERKRRRLHLALAGVFGLVLLGGGAFGWWQDRQASARREEKGREQERAGRNTEAALAQSADLRRRALWKPAEAALDQALAALGPDADPSLRERLEAARRDTRFLARLDELRIASIEPTSELRGTADVLAAYRAIFAEHGFDLPGGDDADLARRVAAHPLRDELVAALDFWAGTEPEANAALRSKIWEVTARVTGEAGRRDLSAAWDSGRRLKAVVGRLDPGRASPSFLALLGYRLDQTRQDGLAFLRQACVRHPADFWVHYATGHALSSGNHMRYADAAGYYRTALAIRPGSLATWRRLGIILGSAGDFDGSVACYRELFRLDPRYPRIGDTLASAHHTRGLDLRGRGDLDGAAADFGEAVRFSPAIKFFEDDLRQTLRWRELLAALPDVAAGRADPKTPAEALEFADLCVQPFQRRYALAAHLADGAFAADPKLAAEVVIDRRFDRATRSVSHTPVSRRYNAARWATLAAAGRDAEVSALGVEEWGFLTGLAYRWLRADLADRAKNSKQRPTPRGVMTYWKQDAELFAVRDSAWLAAMPPADRRRWELLWADVDAVLAQASEPPAKK